MFMTLLRQGWVKILIHLILVLQVRSAYRTLAAKHHPDRQAASEVETTEEEFKRVRMRNPAILGYQV